MGDPRVCHQHDGRRGRSPGAQQKADDDGLTDAEKLLRRLSDATGGAYWKIAAARQLQRLRADRSLGKERD